MTIRPIETLTSHELQLVARDLADAGEPCDHGLEPGTPRADAFEQAYLARLEELRRVGA